MPPHEPRPSRSVISAPRLAASRIGLRFRHGCAMTYITDGTLSVRFCQDQASAAVMYRYVLDEEDTTEWICTPFQTANVSSRTVLNTVKCWLETCEDA